MKDTLKNIAVGCFILVVVFVAMFIAMGATAYAEPHVHGDAHEYKADVAKMQDALSLLAVTDPNWWVFVISEKKWNIPLTKEQRSNAVGSCYTFEGTKITYCNVKWIESVTAERLADSLAHEYGHITCHCADEQTATLYGSRLRRH